MPADRMNFPRQPGNGDFSGRSSRFVQVIAVQALSSPGEFTTPAWEASAYRPSTSLVQNIRQITVSGNLASGLVKPAGGSQTAHVVRRENKMLGLDQRRHDGRGIGIVPDPQRMSQLVGQDDLQSDL